MAVTVKVKDGRKTHTVQLLAAINEADAGRQALENLAKWAETGETKLSGKTLEIKSVEFDT